MIDYETFLTELYVIVDDFCKSQYRLKKRRGRQRTMSQSEIVTLAIAGQWSNFNSEREFYRYIENNFKEAFPQLVRREQLNRQMNQNQEVITAFALYLADTIGRDVDYEALDGTAIPTRNHKRRGNGWLPGLADYGWSNRLGFFEGVHLLTSVTPIGVITGFGFGPASLKDSVLAETFFAARAKPQPRLPHVGLPAKGDYVADKGFSQDKNLLRWKTLYDVNVIAAPKRNSRTRRWPRKLRRWLAGLRQIVETVNEKLHHTFRLATERPHSLIGLQSRIAAKVALHNFCIYFNLNNARNPLSFVDIINW